MITCAIEKSVATITLCRPDARNCITPQLVGKLKDIRRDIHDDKSIRVVILTGAGEDAFCAGADPEAAMAFEDRAKLTTSFSVAATVDTFACPVIAAINGDALGQGLELALACDLRISSQSATFAMPQATAGVIPWDGGTQRLARLVGRGKALEMLLLGECIDAGEAHRIGLVQRVVRPQELMQAVYEIAHKMAAQSPISLAYAKEAVKKGMDQTLNQGLRLEADLYYLMHTTWDRTEGITAFRDKQRPQFEGK